MFNNLFKSIKNFFGSPPLRTQFEEMVLQEELEKKKALAEPAVVKTAPETVVAEPVVASAVVNDQITDAVTVEKPVKPKKAKAKSKDVVEDPAKKPRAPRKTRPKA